MTKPFSSKEPKKPRPVSQRYLQNAAVFYLGRYASSAANLGRVLDRKTRNRNEDHHPPTEEQRAWISAVVEKCQTLGLVNDTEYARMRTISMHRSGKSERVIAGTLRQKGVGEDDIRGALAALKAEKGEGMERQAAIAYAKRRRFGPFRTREGDADKKRRELASFSRAGFAYNLALSIIETTSVEALDGTEQQCSGK